MDDFSPSTTNLIEVTGLARRFGDHQAVKSVSVTLKPGDIHGFVGANGAGKTTTLRMLAGLLAPDSGHGRVLGHDVIDSRAAIRRAVGYMAQKFSLYGNLTVFENIRFRAEVYAVPNPAKAAQCALEAYGLAPYRNARAGDLSGGWARQLMMACALIHHPRLILLDEPTAGLDPAARQVLWRQLGRLAAQGCGIIVNTHDLAEAERCTAVSIFAKGEILAQASPDDLIGRATVEAFLLTGPSIGALDGVLDRLPNLLGYYPQGGGLRLVLPKDQAEDVQALADSLGGSLTSAPVRLEDVTLAMGRTL